MKCSQCGAPITIEDEFCPYCGALNKAARKHMADMKKYNKEFEETRTEVMSNAQGQIRKHSQLAALAVVVLLNIVVFVCLLNEDDIRWKLEERNINKNSASYAAVLSVYEESGDYQGMYSYYSNMSLYMADRGSDLYAFDQVCAMAGYYSRIQDDFYYLLHPDVESYYSTGDLLEHIADQYLYFTEQWDYRENSYYAGCYEGAHLEAMEDMQERLDVMMQSFGRLTDEDMEGLSDMGSQDLMILIGRRMGYYE